MRGQYVRPGNPADRIAQAAAGLLESTILGDLDKADAAFFDELASACLTDLRRYIERVRRRHCDFMLRERPKRTQWVSPRNTPTDTERRLLGSTRSGAFVLMCSGNGFERERALEAVREVPSGFCLGLLILRLNDWVDEVRRSARLALERQGKGLSNNLLLECFELYLSSSDWGRMDDVDRAALSRLFGRVPRNDLISAVIGGEDDRSVKLIQQLLRRDDWDGELARIATAARHRGVRLAAIRALLAGEYQWLDRRKPRRRLSVEINREMLIQRALSDASADVRLAALRAYAETIDARTDAQSRLEGLVLDQSLKVANLGAFWLERTGGDPAGVIRRNIKSGAPPASATLSLLAVVGRRDDYEVLLQTASKHVARRKWAALEAAARLAPDAGVEKIKAVALGDNAVEARRAVRALNALDENIEFDDLIQWTEKPEQFVARRFLDLTHKQAPWRALAIVLSLALHGATIESLIPHFELIGTRSARIWLPNPQERAQLLAMLNRLPVDRWPMLLGIRWVVEHSS